MLGGDQDSWDIHGRHNWLVVYLDVINEGSSSGEHKCLYTMSQQHIHSVWTTVVDRPTLTSHFSNHRCDFHVSRLPLTDIILRHGKFFNLDVNRAFWDLNHLHVAWKTRTEIFKVLLLPLCSLCQISFLQDVFFFFFNTEKTESYTSC